MKFKKEIDKQIEARIRKCFKKAKEIEKEQQDTNSFFTFEICQYALGFTTFA